MEKYLDINKNNVCSIFSSNVFHIAPHSGDFKITLLLILYYIFDT